MWLCICECACLCGCVFVSVRVCVFVCSVSVLNVCFCVCETYHTHTTHTDIQTPVLSCYFAAAKRSHSPPRGANEAKAAIFRSFLMTSLHHLRELLNQRSRDTSGGIWAMSHFWAYLYGQPVTVYTEHAAVIDVLQNPGASGRHARWWTKVHGRGIQEVHIVYRTDKENAVPGLYPGARTIQHQWCLRRIDVCMMCLQKYSARSNE